MRIVSRLLPCALLCLASTLTVTPVSAEEAQRAGWVAFSSCSTGPEVSGRRTRPWYVDGHVRCGSSGCARALRRDAAAAGTGIGGVSRAASGNDAAECVPGGPGRRRGDSTSFARRSVSTTSLPKPSWWATESVHVYAKSLEVLEKVVSVQQRMDIPPGRVGRIPFRQVDAADIVANLEYVAGELRAVRRGGESNRPDRAGAARARPTYSMIYTRLATPRSCWTGCAGSRDDR